ncbi:cell division protein FtsL [Bacterioplanoides pacificum]|uniref:Cell division protein FtsL n=1 Tax=Bacterioplanoides pacificum TaxID=1171596 RepID=A0ABV7VUD2_9GAMM
MNPGCWPHWRPWLALLLWLLVMISAAIQVAQVHQHRSLLSQWQQLDSQRLRLMQEHTRLLLEISTLTAHGRIDQRARKQLNMTEANDIQVLQP